MTGTPTPTLVPLLLILYDLMLLKPPFTDLMLPSLLLLAACCHVSLELLWKDYSRWDSFCAVARDIRLLIIP